MAYELKSPIEAQVIEKVENGQVHVVGGASVKVSDDWLRDQRPGYGCYLVELGETLVCYSKDLFESVFVEAAKPVVKKKKASKPKDD